MQIGVVSKTDRRTVHYGPADGLDPQAERVPPMGRSMCLNWVDGRASEPLPASLIVEHISGTIAILIIHCNFSEHARKSTFSDSLSLIAKIRANLMMRPEVFAGKPQPLPTQSTLA